MEFVAAALDSSGMQEVMKQNSILVWKRVLLGDHLLVVSPEYSGL